MTNDGGFLVPSVINLRKDSTGIIPFVWRFSAACIWYLAAFILLPMHEYCRNRGTYIVHIDTTKGKEEMMRQFMESDGR